MATGWSPRACDGVVLQSLAVECSDVKESTVYVLHHPMIQKLTVGPVWSGRVSNNCNYVAEQNSQQEALEVGCGKSCSCSPLLQYWPTAARDLQGLADLSGKLC